MNKQLKVSFTKNFIFVMFDKALSAVFLLSTTFLLTRYLSNDDLYLYSLFVSALFFVEFISLSIESSVLRKSAENEIDNARGLELIMKFSLLKSIFMSLISASLVVFMYQRTHQINLIIAGISTTLPIIYGNFHGQMSFYESAHLNHKSIFYINCVRSIIGISILSTIYFNHSIVSLLARELILSFIIVMFWIVRMEKYGLGLRRLLVITRKDLKDILSTITDHALWLYFSNICILIIYKADLFFVGHFRSSEDVMYYTLAVNSANLINNITGVVGQQIFVILKHTSNIDDAIRMTVKAMKITILICSTLFVSIYFGGEYFISLLAGDKYHQKMYDYFLYISSGLILVKGVISPLNSFLNLYANMRVLLYRAIFPSCFVATILYYYTARYSSSLNCAKANVAVACVWVVLSLSVLLQHNPKVYDYLFSFSRRNSPTKA